MSQILYVACADDSTIHTLSLSDSGLLADVAVTSVPGPEGSATSLPLALSPDRQRLYAAVRTMPYPLFSFAVAAGGVLSVMSQAPLPHAMAYVSVDHAGANLFGASYPGGLISRSPVDADGAVRQAAEQVIPTPPRAHCILPAPDGIHVHVPCLGGDVILRFRLSDEGLEQVGAAPTHPGAGPRHLVFAPGGAFAYSLNELDATIDAWRVVPDGALQLLQTVETLPAGTTGQIAAADIHLTPDGRYLYASERLTNVLSCWRRDQQTGLLSHIGDVASEATPRGFAIDPTGRYLLCAGQSSHHVACYAIDPSSGVLTQLGRHPVGRNPNWITFLA